MLGRRLLVESPKRHRLTVPVVCARVLKQEQDWLLHRREASWHWPQHSFEIARVTPVTHQIQALARSIEEACVLAAHTVFFAADGRLVPELGARRARIMQKIIEIQFSKPGILHRDTPCLM
jgi:hypothetical protein